MKHCLVLAPLLLSSAAAFTAVNQRFQAFVQTTPSVTTSSASASGSALKVSNFDYHGTSDRIQEAYKAWCRVYNKTDNSRLEIFAYHFLLAEKFSGQTGAPIKLNEHADLTSAEYMALQETGNLPVAAVQPTEVVVSETKASDYAAAAATAEPIAPPANYGTSAASYLDALSSQSQASNALSGAGMTSYLDSVLSNGATLGGPGVTSYLDTVSGAAPLSTEYAASAPTAPFAAASVPEPYVPPPAPPAAAAPSTPATLASATGGNYMDNLSAASSAPTGRGISSYLDSVSTNGAIRGAGMTSYLDSVTSSDEYTPFEAPAAAAAPAAVPPPAPVAQPIVPPPAPPAQPYIPAASNTVASGGRSYMDNLSAASGSAPQGAGISSYLDTVPSNPSHQGGSGMASYLGNMGTASDFATIQTPPASYVPPPPAATPAPVAVVSVVPAPVQESIAPVAPLVVPPRQPSYIPPPQSRNIPGGHWMDTVTPLSGYGSRGGSNGNWEDNATNNERYKRRQAAARNYNQQQEQAQLQHPNNNVGQQYQQQPSYSEGSASQESIAPLAERVQRRQRRQQETFGGGFIIS